MAKLAVVIQIEIHFATRCFALQIEASREIIGRYECNEVSPSVEVAKEIQMH